MKRVKCECGRTKDSRVGSWVCPWDGLVTYKENSTLFSQIKVGEFFLNSGAEYGSEPYQRIEPKKWGRVFANYQTADGNLGISANEAAVVRLKREVRWYIL